MQMFGYKLAKIPWQALQYGRPVTNAKRAPSFNAGVMGNSTKLPLAMASRAG